MKVVIKQTIEKYNLVKQNDCIVVAVSGGADSMALLHALNELKNELHVRLVVAHVNHKKRDNSELDEALVKQVAAQYKLPCEVYELPKCESDLNFHVYARQHRYEFFKAVAAKYEASMIATAHHQDDQLETVIHRMLYYNTVSSLIGIRPKSVYEHLSIIRPIFELTKQDVYEYCQTNHVFYCEDESNESDDYTRNRIRHHIVPALVTESPSVYTHVSQISEQLNEDELYFMNEVSKLMKDVILTKTEARFSRQWLLSLPLSLSTRLLKELMYQLTKQLVSRSHVLDILKVCKQPKPNSSVPLPHYVHCFLEYDTVILTTTKDSTKPYNVTLTLNDKTLIPSGEIVFVSVNKVDEKTEKSCINEVFLCYNEIELPLKVRTRKPGDKIKLMHNKGRKKVKEIMIEAKIPTRLRDSWPIVVDNRDEILWIPLLKKSNYCQGMLEKDNIKIEIYDSEG